MIYLYFVKHGSLGFISKELFCCELLPVLYSGQKLKIPNTLAGRG